MNNISTPPTVSSLFSADYLGRVFDNFYVFARLVCEDLKGINAGADIYPDPAALLSVHYSAYMDIARYKEYHLAEPTLKKSDAVKRSGYFCKWIIKIRPLMVKRSSKSDPTKDSCLLVNEYLALNWMLDNLAQEVGVKRIKLSVKAQFELLYDLQYRELTADGLLAIAQLIYHAATEKRRTDASPLVELSLS